MPLIIRFFKKKKAQQTILGYVENHKDKNGTTTMGGVVFIYSTLLLAFIFHRKRAICLCHFHLIVLI